MDLLLYLLTDRADRSFGLAEHLRRVFDVLVLEVSENWTAKAEPAAIVSDLTLTRPRAIRCLQQLQSVAGKSNIPLICLLRSSDPTTPSEAKALGAHLSLPADAPHSEVVEAIVHADNLGDAVARQLVSRSSTRATRVLENLFSSARAGAVPRMACVEAELAPVMLALKEGGLQRWLETVWAYHDATYQHCLLVTGYAANFANYLGFSRRDQHALVRAALVHDVGKARIPLAILNKPDQLSFDEMSVMRTHAVIGFDLLTNGGECDATTLQAVRHHHELLDGSGYPDGLTDSAIGDTVRLLTICDIYSALTERRPYKAPILMTDALRIMRQMSGQLEPALLEAFGMAVQRQMGAAAT